MWRIEYVCKRCKQKSRSWDKHELSKPDAQLKQERKIQRTLNRMENCDQVVVRNVMDE